MSEVYTWDKVAANNNDAPPDGWPENQAYSSVNNCAREMMAALARDLADRNGTLTTAGTAPAYTLTSNRTITALVDGMLLSFKIHSGYNGAATLNLNSLGAQPIRLPSSGGGSPTYTNFSTGDVVLVVWDASNGWWQLLSSNPGDRYGTVTDYGSSTAVLNFLSTHVGGDTLKVPFSCNYSLPAGLPSGKIRMINPGQFSIDIKNAYGYSIIRTDDPTPIKTFGSSPPTLFTINAPAFTLLIQPTYVIYIDALL